MGAISNKDEAEKFSRLANEWWDLKGPLRVLHQMNPIRLNFIEKHCSFPGKKFLDVGCGGGILSESIAKKGGEVIGIDIGEDVISVARSHVKNLNITVSYQKKTVLELALEAPSSFDVVACFELLEHTPDPDKIVTSCAKLVKRGGHVFFSTVNRTFKSYVLAILGAEYLLRLLPIGTHNFSRFIKPEELAKFVRESGLSVESIQGISFNPLTEIFCMTQNTSINYLMHAVRHKC